MDNGNDSWHALFGDKPLQAPTLSSGRFDRNVDLLSVDDDAAKLWEFLADGSQHDRAAEDLIFRPVCLPHHVGKLSGGFVKLVVVIDVEGRSCRAAAGIGAAGNLIEQMFRQTRGPHGHVAIVQVLMAGSGCVHDAEHGDRKDQHGQHRLDQHQPRRGTPPRRMDRVWNASVHMDNIDLVRCGLNRCHPCADRDEMMLWSLSSPDQRRIAIRGFTLAEILIVIACLLIATVTLLPMGGRDEATRVRAAAALLLADLEYAQAASIGKGADRFAVVMDPQSNGYFVARQTSLADPIAHPVTGALYRVIFGKGAEHHLAGVTIAEESDMLIAFNGWGALDQGGDGVITLRCGSHALTIRIDSATGSASIE